MSNQATQPGVAILGCGYWGMNYVRVCNELPGIHVVVVCDQRLERLQEVERRFPGVLVTTQIEQALQVDGVDAVIICTEAQTHYSIARSCLHSGKHVLVEKPMTTLVDEAEQLIALAESRHLTLMVGHTFLYNSGVRKVKEYIKHASIGKVYYMYARRTNLGPIRRDVSALWDLAPHDISIFNYLLDRTPVWVSAVGAKILRSSHDDVGFISLGYPGGVIGHIHVSWIEPNKVREVVVVGSEKRVVFNDLDTLERVRVFDKGMALLPAESPSFGEYHLQIRDGDIVSPHIEINEPLKIQCEHFRECIVQQQPPLTSGHSGCDVVRVLTAIERSSECNGARVEIM